MKIDFKNLGPLHECKVELGDLTIVTGHNNTGKTYVTYGVFGLLALWRHWLRLPQFQSVAQELITKGQVDFDMQTFAGSAFKGHLTRMAHIYQENLPRVLAAEPERFAETKVHLDLNDCPQIEALIIDIKQTLLSGDTVAIVKAAGEMVAKITRQGAAGEGGGAGMPPIIFLDRWLTETFTDLVFAPCFPRTYIASTERTGAAIFQRELFLGRNRLLEMLADLKAGESLDPFAVMQRMVSSYAYPVQSNVEFLSLPNLEALQRQQGQLATQRPDLLVALEEIVGGTFRTTKEGAYFSPNKQRGLKLRLGESSSAARSLLDVSYYIRHVLRAGDCFMIDEPELNLHPRNQRLIARLIGRLVNAGVRVFLTTHSDYVTNGGDRYRAEAWKQLGTSGSGNHFVEFGAFTVEQTDLGLEPGEYLALLTHSGSRGTGAQVCDFYSKRAMARHEHLPKELKHLAWLSLDDADGQEYWAAMNLMGRYAAANHALIHHHIGRKLGAHRVLDIENNHNFAWKETHGGREVIVHRKGATPAGAGVLGIIPGSMASPGYVVRGKGSPESLNSASHGAGRVMSRTKAMQSFTWSATKKLLAERGVELLSAGLDEVPGVYKDIHAVMAAQTDLVEVLGQFDPKLVKMCPAGDRVED